MTEVRQQRSSVRNRREEINRRDTECAERFLCTFCTTMPESFRGLREFYRRFLPFSNKRVGLFSRQDAKNAKFGKHFFLCGLCAFARDIPIFGCGFAALGLCGETDRRSPTSDLWFMGRGRTNPLLHKGLSRRGDCLWKKDSIEEFR